MPIIVMGNRQDELTWWKEQRGASLQTTPEGGVANVEYSLDDAKAVIAGAADAT